MKLVSLNYEKNLEEDFNKRSTDTEKSLKRVREENVEIEVTKKRACLDTSVSYEERSQKPGVSREPPVSYEFQRSDDEDICFVDEKIEVIKGVPDNPQVTPGALSDKSIPKKRVEISRSVVSEADQDSDIEEIDAPIIPESKRKAPSYHSRVFESEERSFLKPGWFWIILFSIIYTPSVKQISMSNRIRKSTFFYGKLIFYNILLVEVPPLVASENFTGSTFICYSHIYALDLQYGTILMKVG